MLEFTDHELRLIAVQDAAKAGDVPALVEMLGDVDIRHHVLRKLGKLGDPAAAAGVVCMLQAGDPDVRAKAAAVPGDFGVAEAVPDAATRSGTCDRGRSEHLAGSVTPAASPG